MDFIPQYVLSRYNIYLSDLTQLSKNTQQEYYVGSHLDDHYIILIKKMVFANHDTERDKQVLMRTRYCIMQEIDALKHSVLVHYNIYYDGRYIFVYKILVPYKTLSCVSKNVQNSKSLYRQLCRFAYNLYNIDLYCTIINEDNLFDMDGDLVMFDFDVIQSEPDVLSPTTTICIHPKNNKMVAIQVKSKTYFNNLSDMYNNQNMLYRLSFVNQICFLLTKRLPTDHRCHPVECIVPFTPSKNCHTLACKRKLTQDNIQKFLFELNQCEF